MRHALGLLGLLVFLRDPGAARAGALHEVVNGLADRTGAPPPASGKGGGSSGGDGPSVQNPILGAGGEELGGSGGAPPFGQPILLDGTGPDTVVTAFLGLQSIVNSDSAATVAVHAAFDDLGLGVEVSHYWEAGTRMEPAVTLDHLRLLGALRVVRDGPLSVWLEAGPVAVLALEDETLFGGTAGIRVDKHVAGALGMTFQARGAVYAHGILGVECEAALDLWILRAGYRLLAFDVGPPLHGPEIGISVGF